LAKIWANRVYPRCIRSTCGYISIVGSADENALRASVDEQRTNDIARYPRETAPLGADLIGQHHPVTIPITNPSAKRRI
jgi:hypothetical protein